jgi:cobalamin biosynthesis Mg chelatase CobN
VDNAPAGEATTETVSVAEAAERFKEIKATHNARILTNDDVEKLLGNRSGVTVAKNMPPLGPGMPAAGGASQSAASSNTSAQNAASPNAAWQNPASASGASQSSPSAGASANAVQNSAAGSQQVQSGANSRQRLTPAAEAAANASTTPQINRNQQSNDAAGSRRLPATATFLPLLGLLGVVSGGMGVWFRKFRK